jgi:hypothetical protein
LTVLQFLQHQPAIAELVMNSSNPKQVAERYSDRIRHDWPQSHLFMLEQVLTLKFSQYPGLQMELMATGDAQLIQVCLPLKLTCITMLMNNLCFSSVQINIGLRKMARAAMSLATFSWESGALFALKVKAPPPSFYQTAEGTSTYFSTKISSIWHLSTNPECFNVCNVFNFLSMDPSIQPSGR